MTEDLVSYHYVRNFYYAVLWQAPKIFQKQLSNTVFFLIITVPTRPFGEKKAQVLVTIPNITLFELSWVTFR